MILFKPYIVSFLVLIWFTVDTGGSLIIPLLLKLVALKGALFIGTPIALGSFLVGQGIGFIAGNVAGGYAVLKAAQKYHKNEKAKWKSPPVKTTHYKGHGWNGWQSPKYTKGYTKGYSVGNLFSQLVNHHKYQPSYHDYSDDGGGYHESSYGYTAGSTPGQYGPPSTSYGYPAPSYGYGSPAPSYGGYASPSHYTTDYASPKEPSFMDKIISKLPSFLGGKSKDEAPYGQTGPYGFADGSYVTHFDPSGGPQSPVPTYAMYHGTPMHLPGQTFSPPTPGGDKYEFSLGRPTNGGGGGETLFEDSEYTYSSSPYAKPQPKRPLPAGVSQGYGQIQGQEEQYPGDTEVYDGPAKEYTGVMTDYFAAIQSMKQRPYGKPLGAPMGPGEYTDSASLSNPQEYAAASNKDEQILNLASSLHQYAAAQRRKDSDVRPSKTKISPSYVVQKFLEKKLEEQAQKAKDAEQRKEAKELIRTLRKAYLQQLAESLRSDLDVNEGEQADEEELQASEEADDPSSPTPAIASAVSSASPEPSVPTEGTAFQPWVSRYKRGDPKAADTATQNPLLELNSEQLEQVKLLYSFMEEIKQFFTLVSALDEDTCLQKMVCDVHAQSVSDGKSGKVTTYESNMISTFRIMDAIVPFDPSAPEDSSTKYRLAAKIGTVGASADICLRYYSTCGYTSDQIINLGNQVAAATTEASPPETKDEEESTPAPSKPSPVFGTRIRTTTQRKKIVEEDTMPKV